MSQSHIILVRHGEASAAWSVSPDPGLSKRGHLQVKDAKKSLKKVKEKASEYSSTKAHLAKSELDAKNSKVIIIGKTSFICI